MKRFILMIMGCWLALSAALAQPPDTFSLRAHARPAPSLTATLPLREPTRQDSLLQAVQRDVSLLKQENALYRTALDVNSNVFGGISTYFAVMAILLSIIVVAIPVVNYFLVLKPNAKMVAQVEGLESELLAKIEKNFESYFDNLRHKKTQQMLALLDNPLTVPEVSSYFMLNSSDNLTATDIGKIIEFLRNGSEAEHSDLFIINSLVIHSGYVEAEKYYKSVFEQDDVKNYEYAIKYLVENNFPEHLPYVEKIIAAAGLTAHELLLDFFDYIRETYLGHWRDKKAPEKKEIGIRYSSLLFNSDKILQAIEGKEIPEVAHHGPRMDRNMLAGNPFLRETKYYPVYLQAIDEKYKNR